MATTKTAAERREQRKSELAEEWGRVLTRARTAKGYTVRELGEKTGMDPSKVSRAENGKQPITVQDASYWVEVCGLRLAPRLIPPEGPVELGDVLGHMLPPQLEALETLARAMPHLPDVVREMLVREAEHYIAAADRDKNGREGE